MADNKVKFGLKNIHIAVETETDTYDTPFSFPGAVNLTIEPNGEESSFYADDMIYYSVSANQGYTGELEMAMLTQEFETEVLGYELEEETNILIESRNAKSKKFALGFEIDGDVHARRFWMYNCSVTRPSTEAGTKAESVEPQTDTFSFTAAGLSDEKGTVRVKTTELTPEDNYSKWFEKVVLPKSMAA